MILCQITSRVRTGDDSVSLNSLDFMSGGRSQTSSIRPNRLFTADAGIVVYRTGHVTAAKLDEVVECLIAVLKRI